MQSGHTRQPIGALAVQPHNAIREWSLETAHELPPASGTSLPTRRFSKDMRRSSVAPQNVGLSTSTDRSVTGVSTQSTAGSSASGETATSDACTKDNSSKSQYLEQCLSFLRHQYDDLVASLHEEVDRLKRKNRELQFCVVMMQRSMRSTTVDQRHHQSDFNSTSAPTAASQPAGVYQSDGECIGSVDDSHISDKKLDELKVLFLEEEIKDLKKHLDEEWHQTQLLTERLRTTEHQLALERLRSMSVRQDQVKSLSSVTGGATVGGSSGHLGAETSSDNSNIDGSHSSSTATGLPFSATVEPLLVHFPPHPPRPPTLQECQAIVKHLYTLNSQQKHELKQLKLDLRDVLYSHKWTPDAFLLARAYITDDESSEPIPIVSRSLTRIPLKHTTKKLPETAYQVKDVFSLPPMKQVASNQAIERQKRSQQLQKLKTIRQ